VDERERRLAENEALFREVNERTKGVNDAWTRVATDAPAFQVVCECGREDCSLPLSVSVDLYEAVRSHGSRFLVARGHEFPEVETVVDDRHDLLVIEKIGASKQYAERLDPRGRG